MSRRVTTARGLLALYPLAWRRRYWDEMAALVEDDPPSLRGLASLLTGALRAHARPRAWRAQTTESERMRLSIWAVFCCWIGLSVAGASFQKETEESTFALAASQHSVLGFARTLVIVGATLGAAAIAVGGLPLLWQALRQAGSASAPQTLRIGLALPLAGLLLFAATTKALLAAAPAQLEGTSTALRVVLLAPWWTAGAAFALSCALAPRLVLLRFAPSSTALRRASYAGLALLVAMALVTIGLAAYCFALVHSEPSLSGQSGGLLWPSTGLVLGAVAMLAATCTALAAIGATRALAAARA